MLICELLLVWVLYVYVHMCVCFCACVFCDYFPGGEKNHCDVGFDACTGSRTPGEGVINTYSGNPRK